MALYVTTDHVSTETGQYVIDTLMQLDGAGSAKLEPQVGGLCRVVMMERAVRLLAKLPEDSDGHVDTDGRMWIGGTEYPLEVLRND